MQVGNFIRAEQSPFAFFLNTLHEQVRNPVGRMHVMRSTTIVARVLAEVKEFLNIHMPRLKIRTHRSLTLSALIHRNRSVVHNLQERNHTLTATVRAFDMGIRSANAGPVIAKSAGPFAELRVIRNALEDVFQVVLHGR